MIYKREDLHRCKKHFIIRIKIFLNELLRAYGADCSLYKVCPAAPSDLGGTNMRILVAEDERDLNRILTKTLTKAGYSVDGCYDGEEVLDHLLGAEYDAMILDVMMPRKDGFTLVAELRAKGVDTPILFLTARDSVADRVEGLDLGADDYLVKPFDFDELLARVRAMTRKHVGNRSNRFTVGDLTVDTGRQTAERAGREITLLPKEFAILEHLIRNKGVVVSREQLEDRIWNYEYTGSSNNVDVYMSKLRKKIDDGFDTKLIHTIRGAGWVLREEQT